MRLGRRGTIVATLVVALATTACSHGSLTEHVAMSEKLTAWRSISVEVPPAPELEGPEPTSLALFQNDLQARVKRSGIGLALSERGAADLVLRVFVRRLTHAAIVVGTAELTADVELIEQRQNRLLARFTVEATSKGKTEGRHDFNFDSRAEVAIKHASARIVKWLDDHD